MVDISINLQTLLVLHMRNTRRISPALLFSLMLSVVPFRPSSEHIPDREREHERSPSSTSVACAVR